MQLCPSGNLCCRDDTYQFIEDGNQAYLRSNLLVTTTYANNELSLVVYVDRTGRVVFARLYVPAAVKGTPAGESERPRDGTDAGGA